MREICGAHFVLVISSSHHKSVVTKGTEIGGGDELHVVFDMSSLMQARDMWAAFWVTIVASQSYQS
jgi:hypothetical protein